MRAAHALADATRLRIVELLAEGERSAGDLASQFSGARPGVSRHLRILREHGLVRSRVDGRRRVYSLDPGPLDELDAWLTHYRAFWQNRLDALDTEVKRQRRNR